MKRKNSESGFALLLIYAMAAVIAIMMYMQLPRVAFEAQRDKEQLLIDRGEQYKRAVQLYVRKFQRFPADMQALENTQNIRFLRKQYVDPMTGKNEWRLIHVGPGGTFTDSQVYGTQQQKKDANAPQTFITEMQQVGGNTNNPNEGVNLAARRRPRDDPNSNAPLGGSNGGSFPGDPGAPPPAPAPVMVLPDGRIVPATSTGVPNPQPGVPGATGVPGQPGAIPGIPGLPGYPQQPGQPIQGGQPGQPLSGGLPNGFQNQANAPPASAANLINQLLTTPRPQPGQTAGTAGGTGTAGLGNGQVVGGGIAGVASKFEQEGIKSYNDKNSYNQWEFVYDMSKDTTRTGGGMGAQQPQRQAGGQGGTLGSTVPTAAPVSK